MSYLERFDTGTEKIKARIFECGSKKYHCVLCGKRRDVIMCRFMEPVKIEKGICHECFVKTVHGLKTCNCKPPEKPKRKYKKRKKTAKKKTTKKRSLKIKEG